MLNPAIARGVLRFLAKHQGLRTDRRAKRSPARSCTRCDRASSPGCARSRTRLLRRGRLNAAVPVLLAELMTWQWDLDFFRELEPHARAALDWIDKYGDADGDGFIEYRSHVRGGIRNQSWKDSHDSLTHADGSVARCRPLRSRCRATCTQPGRIGACVCRDR